jgi:penicillin G amidase
MKRILKLVLLGLFSLLLLAGAGLAWWVHSKAPQRDGELQLTGLAAPVQVRWDERGVPHLSAANQADLYRALGYLHAQDRLFQMEMLRRLSRGELAEILGPKLLPTDRLFRTLGIRQHADQVAATLDASTPANQSLLAYLDGINQYQASRPAPMEFQILGIPKRPFTPADSLSVAGYLAYSFAAAFRTDPVMTQVRDQLGPQYLRIFDLDLHPDGVLASPSASQALTPDTQASVTRLAALSQDALHLAGLPVFEGSNAWAIAGRLTASGKPLLAGDPHIAFSTPAVWWEAHLKAPDFELYGHFQALNPSALLGHNQRFGWSLTMFQNDDLDLVAEKTDADHPGQVLVHDQWVALESREETITVKGAEPVKLTLRRSPHGPIINDALGDAAGAAPVAMWWAFLATDNPLLQAFHELNRADTLDKARHAASLIHAPGLNVVWANAAGDIGWWAAAQIPERPPGVNPVFVLDGSRAESDKLGLRAFADNPQEENPARGYIVSANHQPSVGLPVPGYYNLPDRARRLNSRLADSSRRWDVSSSQALQLDTGTGYAQRVLASLLPVLKPQLDQPQDQELLQRLADWDGRYDTADVAPTLFAQLLYNISRGALADELGESSFTLLLRTRALDDALPNLLADEASPWWDNRQTPGVETRAQTVLAAWHEATAHLRSTLGTQPRDWTWGRAHTLTHKHPLGQQKPLDRIFDVGPFPAPGGHETPNNLTYTLSPAPWTVPSGPSTRRLIDFAQPGASLGINPVGQSGVWGDRHYADQAQPYVQGLYQRQYLDEKDVSAATRSSLVLRP